MIGTPFDFDTRIMDFDSRKNQEWLRRRRMRLEQVRKQSNEIARTLRQKVMTEEQERLQEYDRVSEANFKDWKAEKLNTLEHELRSALQEFGEGHKQAEAEPDGEFLIEERNKTNSINAKKRGEIALQEEQKKKKAMEEKKMSPIERKKMTRKKEDLRSALIRSAPVRKQLLESQEVTDEKDGSEKEMTDEPVKGQGSKGINPPKVRKKCGIINRKKVTGQKSCLCKNKTPSSNLFSRKSDTIWINLNEIQSSSTGESELRPRSTDSFVSTKEKQREKPEGTVEFYDFSSRFHCRSFREYPHMIERINSETREPNAIELAEIEDENTKEETRKREESNSLVQERGMEALKREKISREYNNLITKLDELQKKEKLLKAQQRSQPNFHHMSDERLSEKLKSKQRIMDSKFEEIYFEALSQMPAPDSAETDPPYREAGGDWARFEERPTTTLSVCSSSLKPNSPIATDKETSGDSSTGVKPRQTIKKKKRQLLEDIEKTLKEGRELRKTVSRNRDGTDFEKVEENQEENLSWDTEKDESVEEEPISERTPLKTTRTQECQTENLKDERTVEVDASLPISTSTCYKSPPSIKKSNSIQQFLEYLEGVSEPEDCGFQENKETLKKKIDKLVSDLRYDDYSSRSQNNEGKSKESQTLEYYIGKLLTMSREYIANLSVSSENISTPNITDIDFKELELKCLRGPSSVEEVVRQSRLSRADCLQKVMTNWKEALEREDSNPEPEDEPDCVLREEPESVHVLYSPKIKSKYDEITRKCSERISELSQMLDRVRKDKEKLLSSASGGSSLSLNKDGRDSEKDSDEEKEGKRDSRPKSSPVVESFIDRFNFTPRSETIAMAAVLDSQSQDLEESLESWPDVMEELLKRKILTSPFKWSEGEYSSELATINHVQPSSIESVIGNFRQEINKFKPFNVSNVDSFSYLNSTQRPRHCSGERHHELFCSPRKITSRWPVNNEDVSQKENSVESINQALTSLGLNWAKSFLRKNEESKAINTSSDSERKSSESEEDDNRYA